MSPENIVFAPVLLPLIGSAFAYCSKAFFRGRTSTAVEYIGVFIGLALPWAVFLYTAPIVFAGQSIEGVVGNWYSGIGIRFRFDGLAWLVNILGFSLGGAAWIYSLSAGPRGPVFSAVFLIQTAALAAAIMTADLFNLFVCLEILGIASYVLIASSQKAGAALASFSYLMVSAAAMVFFLVGLYGLYRLTGNLSYEGIAAGLKTLPDGGGTAAVVSFALIVAAVAIRVAVMPLYGWLPDAHALAPHAISAVLSGVLIKTPLFALSRIMLIVPRGGSVGRLLGYAGAATALVAVVIALSQKDAKRLLAYHSVSQIGYVVGAWGAAIHAGIHTPAGVLLMSAAFLHAFYHALFKGLLFLSVGSAIDSSGERNVYVLRRAGKYLRAAGERLPVTLVCFAIGALAISAVPPFNGYASKTAVTYALKGSVHYYLLTAAAVGTVASFIKLSRIFWPERKRGGKRSVPAAAASGTGRAVSASAPARGGLPGTGRLPLTLSMGFLGLLCIAGGAAASRIFSFVYRLLGGAAGAAGAADPVFFSADNLLKTLYITAGGVVLFFAAVSGPGSKVLELVRERPRNFQGLFVSFSLGLAVLVLWLLV
jgi:formate hydrogenlyase subunit 3/multisubunit Na+/H+ antiporter MnhD subunit